ncbi:hypothetical protein OIO90_000272 [Microbotryomycetes sp. JL221]|nr:hypothetical protein OIO90_000272 [Microbotryomycetes sp. JL221]
MLVGTPANPTSVKVVVRIRPPDTAAAKLGARFQKVVVHPRDHQTLQVDAASPSATPTSSHKATFTFDRVIGPDEGQSDVFEQAAPLVDAFLEGFNVTILAYGQTSSGKSYTMGTDRTFDLLGTPDFNKEHRMGITPRAVNEIFDRIKQITAETKGRTTFKTKLSYVELYNEDLIDLLTGEHDARATVQIREDVKGNIIWSGLKEVTVTSAAEVMNHLTSGSSLRQTGSTDMNAQSSRSHAIFSLTLEQRKLTGGSMHTSASASSSPSPPQSRLPSRASMLPRVTSPTPGSRSSTPTQDRPGSRIGLGLGLRTPTSASSHRPTTPDDDRIEKWTTITSKFHFVDLAGSERLKRTAAAGERVKEGISINSGLHALGNVISALGDPTKKSTHVPYRDSKLTRLLQDSLGGNARTMMIACVSATELNLNETLSTVKYANRARNIKNRAEVNEVEVGWDDVEYLQRTVTKLRAELAGLKNGDANIISRISEEGEERQDASLRDQYNDLQQRYAQQTADLAAAQTTMSGVSPTSMSRSDFAAAIEPVVEEYEKSLSALEGQLSLTRAALAHSEEEMREWESKYDEERQARETHEVLVDTLKARNSKLAERECTTELYIRDLEQRIKESELEDARGSEVSEIRKELHKARDERERLEEHIADIESRLSKADDNAATFKRQIDVLERDIKRREEAYRELESRLSVLDSSGDHKLLLQAIEEKDRKLLELERSIDELRSRSDLAEQEKDRLEKLVAAETEAKQELNSRVKDLERASVVASSEAIARARPAVNGRQGIESRGGDAGEEKDVVVSALEHQLYKLQQSHEATLAQLESINIKYRDSLKEIEELNTVVAETRDGSTLPSTNSGRLEYDDVDDGDDDGPASLSTKDRGSNHRDTQVTPPRRTPRARRSMPLANQHRLSFLGRGQGATTHTQQPIQQHARSSSLSQEQSSAVSSQVSSPASPRLSSPSASSINRESIYGTLIPPTGDRTYDQMKSEVIKLQAALREREDELRELHSTLRRSAARRHSVSSSANGGSPTIPRILTSGASTPPDPFIEPSSGLAPLTPKTRAAFDAIKIDDPFSSGRLDDLMRAMAQKESAHRETVDKLEADFSELRRQHDQLTILSRDQVNNMSAEINQLRVELESRPEASHYEGQLKRMREELDGKNKELEQARDKAEEQILAATTKLANEHQRATEDNSATILRMKEDHAAALKKALKGKEEFLKQLQDDHNAAFATQAEEHNRALQSRMSEYEELLNNREAEHKQALQALRIEHEQALSANYAELEKQLREKDEGHAEALALQSRETDEQHAEALQSQSREKDEKHAESLVARGVELAAQHQEEIRRVRAEHEQELHGLREAHASELEARTNSHAGELEANRASYAGEIESLKELHGGELDRSRSEHAGALEAKSREFDADKERDNANHAAETDRLRQEHQVELEAARKEHSEVISKLEADHREATSKFEADHAEAIARLESQHSEAASGLEFERSEATSRLKGEHSEAMSKLESDHAAAILRLQSEHDEIATKLKSDRDDTMSRIAGEHADAIQILREEHKMLMDKTREDHDSAMTKAGEEFGVALKTRDSEHEAEIDRMRIEHQQTIEAQRATLAGENDNLARELQQSNEHLKAEHAAALATLASEHQVALDEMRSAHEQVRGTEKTELLSGHQQELSNLESCHAEELAKLRSEHEQALKSHLEDAAAQKERVKGENEAVLREREASHATELERLREHEQALKDSNLDQEGILQALKLEHNQALTKIGDERREALEQLAHCKRDHEQNLVEKTAEHEARVVELQSQYETSMSEAAAGHESRVRELEAEHEKQMASLKADRETALQTKESEMAEAYTRHASELEAHTLQLGSEHARQLDEIKALHEKSQGDMEESHGARMTELIRSHEEALANSRLEHEQDVQAKEREHSAVLESLQKAQEVQLEETRASLAHDHEEKTKAATESAAQELANLRSLLEKIETELALVRQERDEFKNQANPPSVGGQSLLSPTIDGQPDPNSDSFLDRAMSPTTDSHRQSMQRKPPPPTPPPSMPPPPLPTSLPPLPNGTPVRGIVRSPSTSSINRHSLADSGSSLGRPDSMALDSKLSRRLDEQEAMIARLTKQLTHCESDLQANIDLVNTLESALNDSERNLRKARTQMNDLAKERDLFVHQNEQLRQQVQDAHQEVESVRNSVIDAESRLQEEKFGKESRARELERRLDEANKGRKSKFACF